MDELSEIGVAAANAEKRKLNWKILHHRAYIAVII
jgi:hypothetical protein